MVAVHLRPKVEMINKLAIDSQYLNLNIHFCQVHFLVNKTLL